MTVLHGDCLELMATMEPNSVDSIVTDPPYELGFMGKKWDGTGIAFDPATWREAFRVLKPGGHLLAFSGTRTSHRMVCAIEDAGFEIRDSLVWMYATGFPKSLDVGKAIDKAAGAERVIVGTAADFARDGATRSATNHRDTRNVTGFAGDMNHGWDRPITAPATPEAEQWQGWGTALKPAHEPICLARKPIEQKTVAANVITHGTGALNIDACRIDASADDVASRESRNGVTARNTTGYMEGWTKRDELRTSIASGRWPANVLLGCCGNDPHDPDCAAALLDEQSGERTGSKPGTIYKTPRYTGSTYNGGDVGGDQKMFGYGDTGGASRFFLTVAQDDSFTYNGVEETECASCGNESTEAANTSAGKRTASNGVNSHIDGYGNKPTDQSPRDTRSTTKTQTNSTTTYQTSNALLLNGTTTTINASERITESLTALNTDVVHDATNTSRSISSPSGAQELITVTADSARRKVSESGEQRTENTPTSTCATGGKSTRTAPIDDPDAEHLRFMYCAKASRSERNAGLDGMPEREKVARGTLAMTGYNPATGERTAPNATTAANHHPTVKPISLMRWLVRLVTPPGGVVLDPFTGSGSTGAACALEGFAFIGMEQDAEYVTIARKRIAHWTPEPPPQLALSLEMTA